jgi:uncharacterized alkaline shock family protein YloU
MNRLLKIALTTYAFFLSAISVVFILITVDQEMLAGIYMLMYTQVLSSPPIRWLVFGVSVFLFVSSAGFLVYGLQSDRLRRTRIRSNDVGVIDIDVDAIESIALNSAKTAQCGIKQAKARVASVKGGKLTIRLTAVLYSDVEIPAMMTKVQDRIKKDIERYTAIPVAGVSVKVSRVEPVAARVER